MTTLCFAPPLCLSDKRFVIFVGHVSYVQYRHAHVLVQPSRLRHGCTWVIRLIPEIQKPPTLSARAGGSEQRVNRW
jgi:hypothetical protein